jgi:hypothetical protein
MKNKLSTFVLLCLSLLLNAQKKDVDFISKGSVWFNTPYPITLENIHDKILVICLWDEQNPFSTEGLHRINRSFESKYNVQIISGILGNAQQPRSRREIYSIIQRENITHPFVICPDFKGFKDADSTGQFQVRIYARSGGKCLHQFIGNDAASPAIEKINEMLNEKELVSKLRSWQLKDSVETHCWADANIEFPSDISLHKNKNFFITETNHHRIHYVNADGTIAQIIGAPLPGFTDGQLLNAQFNYPRGTTFDDEQQLLYVADSYNHRIRAIDLQAKLVFTIAGNGSAFSEEVQLTNGGYEAIGFPVDVVMENNNLYFLSAQFNQVFNLNPISGVSVEVARLPLYNEKKQRIYPKHIEVKGLLGFVTFSDGSIFQINFNEERKSKDAITQKEWVYYYGKGFWFYQPQLDDPKISSVALSGKTLIGVSEWSNAIYTFRKGKIKLLTGSNEGWRDGNAKDAWFHSPVDVVLIDNTAYVVDQDNELLRVVSTKKGNAKTLPFLASDALAFGGNVIPQGENIVFEDVVVGEGPVEVFFEIELGEYEFVEEGVNVVMLIDDAMGTLESEVVTGPIIKAMVDPKDLVYGNLQIEMTYSVRHPLRPEVTLRKQCMVTAMLTVIPGEPTTATVTWKPHLLPF